MIEKKNHLRLIYDEKRQNNLLNIYILLIGLLFSIILLSGCSDKGRAYYNKALKQLQSIKHQEAFKTI
jgi:hypothetical protein